MIRSWQDIPGWFRTSFNRVRCYFDRRRTLAKVRTLIELQQRDGRFAVDDTGQKLRDDRLAGSRQRTTMLIYGVHVEESLYYEALGLPMGERPHRPDAWDRAPGRPASTLSNCERCGISWKWLEPHTTMFRSGTGVFALCERCWAELAPSDRMFFYRLAFDHWKTGSVETWKEIERAVLEGK